MPNFSKYQSSVRTRRASISRRGWISPSSTKASPSPNSSWSRIPATTLPSRLGFKCANKPQTGCLETAASLQDTETLSGTSAAPQRPGRSSDRTQTSNAGRSLHYPLRRGASSPSSRPQLASKTSRRIAMRQPRRIGAGKGAGLKGFRRRHQTVLSHWSPKSPLPVVARRV